MTTAKIFLSHQMGRSKIIIDGKDISGYVRSIDISQSSGGIPSIGLDMYIPNCELEIENGTIEMTSVELPQSVKDTIIKKITIEVLQNDKG